MLTQQSISDALGAAKRRGVDVRVLLEERPYGATRYAKAGYQLLHGAGVNVRWANESAFRYTHEKAMEIDNRVAGIFTFNLTGSGIDGNREFGVIDPSSRDARTLAAVFNADWNRRPMRLESTRLVISPYNSRHDFASLIDSAKHTLDVYAEEVADNSIESHLLAARRRHVRVRLITSDNSAGVGRLRRGGVGVAIMASPYVHAKAIVADGVGLFLGSENISATSLDRNREAGILLHNRQLARVVERTFGGDWDRNAGSTGTNPPPPPTGGGFRVRVSASPPTLHRGQLLTITVATSPGAACSIRVTYPDGYVSRASALEGIRTASRAGSLSWSWHMSSSATGTGRADVSCRLGSKSGAGRATFQIL